MKTILLALILGVSLQAVAQQQEWGEDNCLWTSTGNRSWAQTNACRILEGGNPNTFVIYDRRDTARTPIMRVDLSRAATGWAYGYDYAQRSDFRYIYRGVWNPPPANSADYQVYNNGAWVTPPPQSIAVAPQPTVPMQGAPTMSPEAKASNEAAAPLMTHQQMHDLGKAADPNGTSATPQPVCGMETPSNVPCYSH